MTEPKVFYITRIETAEIAIQLPSGKFIKLVRGGSYKTEDPEEIAFLCGVKHLGCRDVDDKEYRIWAQKRFEELPCVDDHEIKTIKDVEEFLWKDPQDKLILMFLEQNGYTVTKNNEDDDLDNEDDDQTPPEETGTTPDAQALVNEEPPAVINSITKRSRKPSTKNGKK